MLNRRAPQSQRDVEAAALDCVWLAECISSKIKCPIRHTKCGYEWEAQPKYIRRGHGCPKCAGRVLDLDQRRKWAENVNCTWLEDPINTKVKTLIKCNQCGLEWKVVPKDTKDGHGCRKCNTAKFDYKSPAKVYLVENGFAAKVGITSVTARQNRLEKLARYNWKKVKTWNLPTGKDAAAIERKTISWFRKDLEVPPAYEEGIGASETVKLNDVPVDQIIKKIDKLIIGL